MENWLKSVDDNGFHGGIVVNFTQDSFQGTTVQCYINSKQGQPLFDFHVHGDNLAESFQQIIQSILEHAAWNLKNDEG